MGNQREYQTRKEGKKAKILKAKQMNEIRRKKKLESSSGTEMTPETSDPKRPRLCAEDKAHSSNESNDNIIYHELKTALEKERKEIEEFCDTIKTKRGPENKIEVEQTSELKGVEESRYTIEAEIAPEKEFQVGRRIINVTKFLEKLYKISNHGPLDCGFSSIQLVGEVLNGLSSKFTFVCKMCKLRFIIENDDDDALPINTSAVAATISIGCGHSQLQQFSSAVNLPLISQKTYKVNHKLLSEHWEQLAQQSMDQAAEEERQIAISEGKVTKDGTPVIDVLVDGVYSKRSYKKNYSALSGAAAIIGRRTGKILYMGVRNKYCYQCDRAEKKSTTAPEHFCCKNYSGPSTGMESEIIVEGFRQSLPSHGLIYGRMISDGDSCTYSKILEARPYKDITVEKVECRNHLLRNFCNKMQSLKTETKYLLKDRKLLTTTRILAMRRTIIKAIQKNKSDPCPQEEHLFEEIMQAHCHVFGNHVKCRTHFCDKAGKVEQDDIPKEFTLSSLWQRICLLIQSIASHARSLLHDVDSNVVERYHSVIAKYVGGKRINFSLKDSYQTRCKASAVSFNEENALSKLFKQINQKSPRGKLKMLEDRKYRMKMLSKRYYRKKTRIPVGQKSKDDKHYGEKCEKPDVPQEVFEKMKQDFLTNLKKTDEERSFIERKTVLQRASGEWLEMRRSLLCSSNFGTIMNRRATTSSANFVKNILYKQNLDHVESIKHGQRNEKIALAQLAAQENVTIQPCGLFIDKDLCFLGSSPDGLIGDDTVVEIKCPITANKMGLDAAIEKKKVNFWTKSKNGEVTVNKKHAWYYQIQGQLHITQRKYCLFAVWVNESEQLKTELIQRDDELWGVMKEKLSKFYMDCLLPEIIDPRVSRNMSIRESYIGNKNVKLDKDRNRIKEPIRECNDTYEFIESDDNLSHPSTSTRHLDFDQY